MQFSLPLSQADWLPFASAALTALLGLVALFAPRLTMRGLGLETARSEALAEIRGTLAGPLVGVGVVTLLFYDQPFLQMTLGAVWLMAAFGRLVSILSDAASTAWNWIAFLLSLLLSALCLGPLFGFVPAG